MKSLLRHFLINLGALWTTTQIFPAITITGGVQGLLVGALAFMVANILLVPILRILLLPLNLLTLGLFAWVANVLALYVLITIIPNFQLSPYHFQGTYYGGFAIPQMDLTIFQVVIVASFLIGFMIHFLRWLVK